MAVTMNIDSAVWAAPGSVTFSDEAVLDFDFGGDVVEQAAGTEDHISSTAVVNIRGLYTIGFNDRATLNSLLTKLNTEATMTMRVKDIDAATGQEIVVLNSKLQRVRTNAQFNAVTLYSAVFYARSSDGSTSPVSGSAY